MFKSRLTRRMVTAPSTRQSRRSVALSNAIKPLMEGLETRRLMAITADPGGPYTLNEGASVSVSGANSVAGMGQTITQYKWDLNYNAGAGFHTTVTGQAFSFSSADGNAVRNIALRVVDSGGGTNTVATTITTSNVAPTLTLTGASTIGEGESYALAWSKTDPGADTISGWSVDWGDGASSNFAANIANSTHSYTVADDYTITLSATDEDGTYTQTKALTVTDVVPIVEASGAATVNEGADYTVNFSSPNRANSLDGWIVAWGDGNLDFINTGENSASHAFSDNGTYTVTVTALESDGGIGEGTVPVSVQNVDPTVAINGTPVNSRNEGAAISFTSTVTDPSTDDVLTYGWTVRKSGVLYTLPGGTTTNAANFAFTPRDNGSYTVRLTVEDDDGGSTTTNTSSFTVVNVNPTASIGGVPVGAIDEGDAVSLTATAADAGSDDTLSYAWSVTKGGQAYNLSGVTTNAASFTFTPNDNGSYVASVVVSDDDAGNVTISTAAITVNNVDPTASVSAAGGNATTEGSTLNFTAAPADAGAGDTFNYAWSVEKDGSAFALPNAAVTDEESFAFVPTDNGDYVVTVEVTDDDGASVTESSGAITITNVAPTGSITAPASGVEGSPVAVSVTPADAGSADAFTYAWTVTKDGQSFDLTGETTDAASLSFTPDDQGTYVASVVVTDDDGDDVTVNSADIAVTNVDPTVAINGTPVGNSNEGASIAFTSAASDPGDDSLTYGWTVRKSGVLYTLPGGTTLDGTTFSFTPRDNGAYSVRLTVQDDDGGSTTTNTSSFTVVNVNPTASIGGVPVGAIDEGDAVSLTATAADAGSDDTLSYAWSVTKGGQPYSLTGVTTNASSFTFTPNDNGSYVASVVVSDDDAGTVTVSTAAIVVNNVDPTVTVSPSVSLANANEGTVAHLTAAPADVGAGDTFSYAWTVTKDGNPLSLGGGVATNAATFTFTIPDEGDYVVTCQTSDDDGGTASDSYSFTAVNVNPAASIQGAPANSFEGQAIALTPQVTDGGAGDAFSYAWSVLKNGNAYATGNTANFSFTPNDNGSYAVSLAVTDGDGGSGTASPATITVLNTAPAVAITGQPNTTAEGSTVSLTATPTDAGSVDTFTYAWTVTKNGSAYALPGGTTTNTAAFSFAPNDNGNFVATCVVTDDDGGATTASTGTIAVTNVVPNVSMAGTPANAINEGDTVSLTSTASDAGSADVLTYAWTVTRNSQPYNLSGVTSNGTTFSFAPNDNGTYRVTLTVSDDDSASGSVQGGAFTVNNVNPAATVGGEPGGSIAEGTPVSLTAAPADAGSADTFTYAWTLTKNGNPFTLPQGTNTTAAAFTFTPTDEGTWAGHVTVSDDDGGSVSVNSTNVTVTNAAPTATVAGYPISTINEGVDVTLTATGSDVGATDTIAFAWTVTRDGQTFDTGTGTEFTFTPDDQGVYVVSLTATDNDGGSTTLPDHTVNAVNVAPTADIAGGPTGSVNEGSTVNFTVATADDSSADVAAGIDVAWVVTSGDDTIATGDGEDVEFVADDNGTYHVEVTATDKDGDDFTIATNVTATNVAPTGTITGTPSGHVHEGDDVEFAATATDPSDADIDAGLNFTWLVRRSGEVVATGEGEDFTFIPTDNGTYTVSLTTADKDSGSRTANATVIADNVAPSELDIAGTPVGSVAEGDSIEFNGTAGDAGEDDTLSYAWTVVRAGTDVQVAAGADDDFTFTPADNGSYTVRLTATDDDGGSTSTTATVTATNAAPEVTLTTPEFTSIRGRAVGFEAEFDDAGSADSHTVTWNYGDGSANEVFQSANDASLNRSHAFGENGTYQVSVTIADDDGGSDTMTGAVTVRDVALQVDPFDSSKTALVVVGTSGSDNIRFTLNANNRVRVNINGNFLAGTYAPTGRIIAYGEGGTNNIALKGVNIPAVFVGGSGKDVFAGGSGNDVLIGRKGKDALYGYGGRDILIGGSDADLLDGDAGEDLLIGGNLSHAEDLAALAGVFREWSGSNPFAARITALRGQGEGLNGGMVINSTTTTDDARADVLLGGTSKDWLIGNQPDQLADFRFGYDQALDLNT